MEEERAYVEWLKGQQNVKDTKPAMEMVSWKKYDSKIIHLYPNG